MNLKNIIIVSFCGVFFQSLHASELPATLTFLNDTGETIIITSPYQLKIKPGQSFTLDNDNHEDAHIRWYIPQNIDTGIYISHAVFVYKRNELKITELYDENPLGTHPVLKPFKRIIPIGASTSNFRLFKNSRLIDIELES